MHFDVVSFILGAIVGAGGSSVVWYYHFNQLDKFADSLIDRIDNLNDQVETLLTKKTRKTTTKKSS